MNNKKSFAIIGGGRWSRILVSYLHRLTSNDVHLIWVSSHSQSKNSIWLRQQNMDRVQIVSHDRFKWSNALTGVFIATASEAHDLAIENALRYKIPALCEKPLTFSYDRALSYQKQTHTQNLILGVHFEFLFAEYLIDFASQFSTESIQDIEIHWHDPVFENRGEENKVADLYTPITQDCYGHCLSILKIFSKEPIENLIGLKLNSDSSILIANQHKTYKSNFYLSRRARKRKRAISINQGKYELDFSIEPNLKIRTLEQSISSFLNVIQQPNLFNQWPLAIHHCLDSVRWAEQASVILFSQQQAQLKKLVTQNIFNISDENHQALILDLFLPASLSESGLRLPLSSEIDFKSATEKAQNFFQIES